MSEFPSASLAQKRVMFNSVVQQVEYTPITPESSSEHQKASEGEDSSEQDDLAAFGEGLDFDCSGAECGSSDEDMQSGSFYKQIELDRARAQATDTGK